MPTFDQVNKDRYAKLNPNYRDLNIEYEECTTTSRPIVKRPNNKNKKELS